MPTRREVLGAGLAALGLSCIAGAQRAFGMTPPPLPCAHQPLLSLPAWPPSVLKSGVRFAPFFTGDDFEDPATIPFHSSWSGTIPSGGELVDVAVVGGGISGLAAAYFLRNKRPVVLDLRPRFGGNALGERWMGTDYSLGSAYVITPDPGSVQSKLYRQLGLHLQKRTSAPPDPIEINGQLAQGFWQGAGLSTAEQLAFQQYASVVTDMAENQYPEIPLSSDPAAAAAVLAMDAVDFQTDLVQRMGMPLPPLLAGALQAYFYSSFGAGMQEISAASGWNFVAAEEFGRWVFPGGNAGLAQALWEKLRHVELTQPASAGPMLRPGCRVVDVRRDGQRTKVTWVDAAGNTQSLRARAVVMAGSKHVAKHVLHDITTLDPDKYEAMQRVGTSAYLVANVLLSQPVALDFYDIFLVHDAAFPMNATASELDSRPADVLNGAYARTSNLPRSVLSFYWPLPWPSARFALILNDPYNTWSQRFLPQMQSTLSMLGVSMNEVRQVRISRWGHAMPIAEPQFIADGMPQELMRPFQQQVWFANQDNWALPAIENSLDDAHTVAQQIKAYLS